MGTELASPTQDGPCIYYCMIRQANERLCENASIYLYICTQQVVIPTAREKGDEGFYKRSKHYYLVSTRRHYSTGYWFYT